jgi:hypothetical protein
VTDLVAEAGLKFSERGSHELPGLRSHRYRGGRESCFAAERRKRRGLGKPETFNFLGFTFIYGKTRAGKFQIRQKTRADRKEIKQEMRRRMHQPIANQGKWLGRVVRGYFNYHAVPTNGQALNVFRHHVTDLRHCPSTRQFVVG